MLHLLLPRCLVETRVCYPHAQDHYRKICVRGSDVFVIPLPHKLEALHATGAHDSNTIGGLCAAKVMGGCAWSEADKAAEPARHGSPLQQAM